MQRLPLLLSVVALATVYAADLDISGNAYATEDWTATFSVDLDGKAGGEQKQFSIKVHPKWAPEGAKRFQDILASNILKDARFFRVVPGFMVQFGIPGAPEEAKVWREKTIKDDTIAKDVHNTKGMMTFATSGKDSRTTQMFINFGDNSFLDSQGFSPFAEVLDNGMDVVDQIQAKYKEDPNQGSIQSEGNAYLASSFPDMSFVSAVTGTAVPAALKESL